MTFVLPSFGSSVISAAPASGGGGGGGASGFNISIRDTHTNITSRTGDAAGTIAFGTDTYDLYIFFNSTWHFYFND